MPALATVRFIAGLLAPPRCAICGTPCTAAEPLCSACAHDLDRAPAGAAAVIGVGPVVWAAPYEAAARELVAALKFRGSLGLARVAGSSLAAALARFEDPSGWTVVGVPAAPLRRRRRGFDPAELIAGAVASGLGLERAEPLARANGPRQVGRRRSQRLASPPRVRAAGRAPRRALLVDDVLTTGATLAACAAALRAAGTTEIRAAVFARALGPSAAGA